MPDHTVQTLHENTWLSLKVIRKPEAGISGYVYSHESRCQGRIVAVLPYRRSAAGHREYLTKRETTPCWSLQQVRSAITGGYEGGDIEDDAVRELLEETGYPVTRDELIPLGESYASKSADTVYSLFSVDLTGREAGEANGRLRQQGQRQAVTIGDLRRENAELRAAPPEPPDLAHLEDLTVRAERAEQKIAAAVTALRPLAKLKGPTVADRARVTSQVIVGLEADGAEVIIP